MDILSDTIRLLRECQKNELSSPSHTEFFLVTELSCLLVLQEYDHARHLWHRYKDCCPSEFHTFLTQDSRQSFSVVSNELADLYQFFVMWHRIAKPMLMYQPHVVFSNARALLSDYIPFPLHTLIQQLIHHYQNSIFKQMEETIDNISEESLFRNAFGFDSCKDSDNVEDMRNVLRKRGWTKQDSSQYWIPVKSIKKGSELNPLQKELTLHSMIQTVEFLEKKFNL